MRRVLLPLSLVVGCGTDFTQPSPPSEFTPDPPSVYVAKVKNVLVGEPPTDAEITAVNADPNAHGARADRGRPAADGRVHDEPGDDDARADDALRVHGRAPGPRRRHDRRRLRPGQ